MIVLVAPRLGFHGGVERHVADLAHGLRARGARVALAFGPLRGKDPDTFASAFDDAQPLRQASGLWRHATVVYAHKIDTPTLLADIPRHLPLLAAVHDHDATCVRRHRYLPWTREPCSRVPGAVCVGLGCSVVRSQEGLLPVAMRNPFQLIRDTRLASKRAHLVTCSAYLRRTLLDAGIQPGRVSVVHPVPPEDPSEPPPPPNEQVVSFVGQVIRGKGLDILLRAIRSAPDVHVLVAGEGNDMPYVERLIEKWGLANRVSMLGALPPDKVNGVYDRSRIVVVPSRWPEPFGMVGVEAMRRGRPVIAAWHGGIPEWLDHGTTGLGFGPGDTDDLAFALRHAMTGWKYEGLAQAARTKMRSQFRFSQMLDQIGNLLRRVSH